MLIKQALIVDYLAASIQPGIAFERLCDSSTPIYSCQLDGRLRYEGSSVETDSHPSNRVKDNTRQAILRLAANVRNVEHARATIPTGKLGSFGDSILYSMGNRTEPRSCFRNYARLFRWQDLGMPRNYAARNLRNGKSKLCKRSSWNGADARDCIIPGLPLYSAILYTGHPDRIDGTVRQGRGIGRRRDFPGFRGGIFYHGRDAGGGQRVPGQRSEPIIGRPVIPRER